MAISKLVFIHKENKQYRTEFITLQEGDRVEFLPDIYSRNAGCVIVSYMPGQEQWLEYDANDYQFFDKLRWYIEHPESWEIVKRTVEG